MNDDAAESDVVFGLGGLVHFGVKAVAVDKSASRQMTCRSIMREVEMGRKEEQDRKNTDTQYRLRIVLFVMLPLTMAGKETVSPLFL